VAGEGERERDPWVGGGEYDVYCTVTAGHFYGGYIIEEVSESFKWRLDGSVDGWMGFYIMLISISCKAFYL
jgi:hypothetical protein